jgi:hypothetical protein
MSGPTSINGAEILLRTLRPIEGVTGVEAAKALLQLKLSEDDQDRVNELSSKARRRRPFRSGAI